MLALSSGWLGDDRASRLAAAAEAARATGFGAVHAAKPPEDAVPARAAIERLGLALAGVAALPLEGPAAVGTAVERAAAPAAALRARVVVVDAGDLAAVPGRSGEAEVEALARALHEALGRWPGLSLALRPAGRAGRLAGFRETGWILDALAGRAFGLWLDPARALRLEREARAAGETPAAVLDWADRYGARTLGVAVHGLGAHGGGHAHPEEDGPDWGTLRGLLPSRAHRVLDVGPAVSAAQVVDARRRFEEVLGW